MPTLLQAVRPNPSNQLQCCFGDVEQLVTLVHAHVPCFSVGYCIITTVSDHARLCSTLLAHWLYNPAMNMSSCMPAGLCSIYLHGLMIPMCNIKINFASMLT